MLGGVEGHDAVDARLHRVATGEAERVADVDDGGADFGGDEAEFGFSCWLGGALSVGCSMAFFFLGETSTWQQEEFVTEMEIGC